jgi:hypothetical protein
MNKSFKLLNTLWQRWAAVRQRWLNGLLSRLYERPVRVVPTHTVALAGAAVLWVWQGGTRQLIMVRPKEGADTRARFISCLGLGQHPEMASALQQTLRHQLGATFTRLLPKSALALDKVAAAPLLSMTDEDTGGQLPLQVLAWVAEVRPQALDLLELGTNLELVLVAENAIGSTQISPTHRTLWQAVQRHVPKAKPATKREDSVAIVEDDSRLSDDTPSRKGGRVLH